MKKARVSAQHQCCHARTSDGKSPEFSKAPCPNQAPMVSVLVKWSPYRLTCPFPYITRLPVNDWFSELPASQRIIRPVNKFIEAQVKLHITLAAAQAECSLVWSSVSTLPFFLPGFNKVKRFLRLCRESIYRFRNQQ